MRVEIFDTERASHVSEGEEPETNPIRMRLVSTLADRWSSENLGSGQHSWFELLFATN